jgi:hypothetical protein
MGFRHWRGASFALALLLIVVALPVHADPTSDLFRLFYATSGTAADAGFNQGERVSLLAKVIHAIDAVSRGNDDAAIGDLGAFANEINALEQSGRLSPEQADALAGAANAIIDQL